MPKETKGMVEESLEVIDMFVWRAMSEEEYYRWRNYSIEGLFTKPGKTKKMVWFATEPGYISEILVRPMYMNRKVSEAYNIVVMFDLKLKSEIPINIKPENGYVNVGIKYKHSDALILREIFKWTADEWLEKFGFYVKPRMYYWNRNGRLHKAYSGNEMRNILINGNLIERPWFARADVYDYLRKVIERQSKDK